VNVTFSSLKLASVWNASCPMRSGIECGLRFAPQVQQQ
jgi:hypothetical protein